MTFENFSRAQQHEGAVSSVEGEAKRTNTEYRKDIGNSSMNIDLLPEQTLSADDFIEKRINEVDIFRDRKNTVVLNTGIIQLPPELENKNGKYPNGLSEEQTRFFTEFMDYFKDRYGAENFAWAVVHMDERRPHLQFAMTPVCVGKTGAAKGKTHFAQSEIFGNQYWGDRIHKEVEQEMSKRMGHKLTIRTKATNREISASKQKSDALDAEIEAKQKVLDSMTAEEKAVSAASDYSESTKGINLPANKVIVDKDVLADYDRLKKKEAGRKARRTAGVADMAEENKALKTEQTQTAKEIQGLTVKLEDSEAEKQALRDEIAEIAPEAACFRILETQAELETIVTEEVVPLQDMNAYTDSLSAADAMNMSTAFGELCSAAYSVMQYQPDRETALEAERRIRDTVIGQTDDTGEKIAQIYVRQPEDVKSRLSAVKSKIQHCFDGIAKLFRLSDSGRYDRNLFPERKERRHTLNKQHNTLNKQHNKKRETSL